MSDKFMQAYVNGKRLAALRAHPKFEALRQDTLRLQREALDKARSAITKVEPKQRDLRREP
jgi:hypothetical protein